MFVEHALCQYYRDSILGTQPLHLEKKVLIASQAMRNDSQLVHKCNHVHDAAIPMVTLNVFAIMRPLSPGDFECVSHRERQKKPSRPF